jgi:hemolysin activation/secretion protein
MRPAELIGIEEERGLRILNLGGLLRPAPGLHTARNVCLAGCLLVAFSGSMHAQPVAQPASAEPAVQVQGYSVEGNTLLPVASISQALAGFTGQANLQKLRDAAAAVQSLYRQAGFGGVVAFLPEQKPAGGVIRIRVVEGRLSRVDVVDNQRFSSENILRSLPALELGKTPAVRRIDEQIQIANENPAKSLQVLLQPGAEIGTVAARVSVVEQDVQRLNARLDNTGSERTGRWRTALGWQHANVAGLDQVINIEAQTAPERPAGVAVLSTGYRVPLYAHSMALDGYAVWSDVDGGKTGTAAGELQFSGRGTVLGLRGTAYLQRWSNVDQRLSLGLEWREYRNDCSVAGLPQGACGAAGASVALHPLGLQYIGQSVGELRASWALGVQRNLQGGGQHAAAADFEAARPGAKPDYTVWRGNGTLGLPLVDLGSLNLRATGQFSAKPLVAGESFGLGGSQSVRGYEERELGGDSGAQLSLEWAGSPWADGAFGVAGIELHGLAFFDAGAVANRNGDPCLPGKSRCQLASVGIGLRLNRQQLQLRLDVAQALKDAASTMRGDARVHFGLSTSF